MICIIDYGIGNLAAIHNMLRRLGIPSCISSDPKVIAAADKLILPGIGAFDEGMTNLKTRGLIEPLTALVQGEKKPLLGICLGMQLLGTGSEEGGLPGLGWLPMRFHRFKSDAVAGSNARMKTLHMGWNEAASLGPVPLLAGYDRVPRFYFVHGYYAVCDEPRDVLATTTYGVSFASVVGRANIMGAQFHPEKSHRYGMTLLRNFAEMT